jgi:hypothetical protein
VRIISVGRRRMIGRERLGLGQLRPPRLRVAPADAQQRIGQSVLDAIAGGDALVLARPHAVLGQEVER